MHGAFLAPLLSIFFVKATKKSPKAFSLVHWNALYSCKLTEGANLHSSTLFIIPFFPSWGSASCQTSYAFYTFQYKNTPWPRHLAITLRSYTNNITGTHTGTSKYSDTHTHTHIDTLMQEMKIFLMSLNKPSRSVKTDDQQKRNFTAINSGYNVLIPLFGPQACGNLLYGSSEGGWRRTSTADRHAHRWQQHVNKGKTAVTWAAAPPHSLKTFGVSSPSLNGDNKLAVENW